MNKILYEKPELEDYIIEQYGNEFILGKQSGLVLKIENNINAIMIYLEQLKKHTIWLRSENGVITKYG